MAPLNPEWVEFEKQLKTGATRKMTTAYAARWAGPVHESDDPYPDGSGYSAVKQEGNSMKIAVVSDLHFADADIGQRAGSLADILLLRTVHRLNRMIRPDVVLFVGDMLNAGDDPDGEEKRQRLKKVISLLDAPAITIPGNHDGDAEAFYRSFGAPPEFTDIAGTRFIAFVDPEEPDYNALRPKQHLERMLAARRGWNGPIIMLQHVPVFPHGSSECPYHYINGDEVIAAMRQAGITLSISGHYHEGFDLVTAAGLNFSAAPALCEAPFSFLLLNVEDGKVAADRHDLAMPSGLQLFDWHAHSPFAYCNENMDIPRSARMGTAMGLAGISISEHSAHLAFSRERYGRRDWFVNGIESASSEEDRTDNFFDNVEAARKEQPSLHAGIELDFDARGNPVGRPEQTARAEVRLGAVHQLAALTTGNGDSDAAKNEFLFLTRRIAESGVRALAHPFRVFRRGKVETPADLFVPVAELLKKHGVAAELNFHTNEPSPEFFRICIESGVKIALGSDAHNMYEVGEFAPHMAFLRKCGVGAGDLAEILIPPPA